MAMESSGFDTTFKELTAPTRKEVEIAAASYDLRTDRAVDRYLAGDMTIDLQEAWSTAGFYGLSLMDVLEHASALNAARRLEKTF